MIEIEDNDYRLLASELKERIGEADFFNSTVEYDTDRFYSTLTVTAIVYRSDVTAPQGRFSLIEDVMPVWWDFSTVCDGRVCMNDFSFDSLREYIKEYTV